MDKPWLKKLNPTEPDDPHPEAGLYMCPTACCLVSILRLDTTYEVVLEQDEKHVLNSKAFIWKWTTPDGRDAHVIFLYGDDDARYAGCQVAIGPVKKEKV